MKIIEVNAFFVVSEDESLTEDESESILSLNMKKIL